MVSKYFLPQAYADYLGFVLTLNDGVKGRKITSEYKVSEVCCVVLCCVYCCLPLIIPCRYTCTTLISSICVDKTVEKLLDLLGTLDQWINETPPVDQPSRFGNKAFRTWYGKLDQVCARKRTTRNTHLIFNLRSGSFAQVCKWNWHI